MAMEAGKVSGVTISKTPNTPIRTKEISTENLVQQTTQPTNQRVVTTNTSQQHGGETNQGQGQNDDYSIQDVSPEKVKAAVKEANNKIRLTSTGCEFRYHEDTKRISIKVIDKTTGDVIKEIPPEKTLDMIARAWEIAGILVDEKR